MGWHIVLIEVVGLACDTFENSHIGCPAQILSQIVDAIAPIARRIAIRRFICLVSHLGLSVCSGTVVFGQCSNKGL